MRLYFAVLMLPLAVLARTPEDLLDAFARDSTLVGQKISVQGRLTADFFREIFIQAPGQSRGLRVKTGEHLGELGHLLQITGGMERDATGPFLRARIVEVLDEVPRPVPAQKVSAEDLKADPHRHLGGLVDLGPITVSRLLRDYLAAPWLMVLGEGSATVDVEVRDGSLPPVVKGDSLAAVRGVWRRVRERWRLSPRSIDDFSLPDSSPADLMRSALTDGAYLAAMVPASGKSPLLLDEICYDTFEPDDDEGAESFAIVNVGRRSRKLKRWKVSDGIRHWALPANVRLKPGERLRVARKRERYFFEFGRSCDLTFTDLTLPNEGGALFLIDGRGALVDAVRYGRSAPQIKGWSGEGAQPYRFTTYVPSRGAVLLRKLDRADRLPLDSDTPSDWIGDAHDPLWGRQLNFPGWDRDLFFDTARCEEEAEVTALVSPDHSYDGVVDFLRAATQTLEIEIYLITHPGIVAELLAAMDRGVRVTILLEGEVFGARGGTYDTVRGLMRLVVEHPSGLGHVYFWRNGDDPRHLGPDASIPDRYNHCHQKFVLADRKRVLIGSDNFTQSSLPADDKTNGTGGSRGVFLITDASCVLERAIAIWEADFDPRRHRDIRLFVPGSGLSERLPKPASDRRHYQPVRPLPYSGREVAAFELVQSPETFLRPDRGYLGLINRAGAGDTILVEQQYERPHWGYADRRTDNPRLAACLEAARRGACVRLLLSGNRPTPKSEKTREIVATRAREEGLDIEVRLGWLPRTPKRKDAIHNKMLLVALGDEKWSHVGSANGSETASRYNRELGLSVRSDSLFDYLRAMFDSDWERVAAR